MTRAVLGDQGSLFSRVAACYLAPLIAAPVALIGLAFVLNTVVGARGYLSARVVAPMPVSQDAALVGLEKPAVHATGGIPLSTDTTNFEKVRSEDYVVQPGDTIWDIAQRFNLDWGTILAMNSINDVRRLLPGTVLSIAKRDGLPHAVQPGESLSSIADSYGISLAALADANDVKSPILQVGDTLFVPGATMDSQMLLQMIGELFNWPVRSFSYTAGFGMQNHPISGVWYLHNGIDLANRIGTPVRAAGAGRVVHVDEQASSYGKMIIIDHNNGYRTLYGHLNSFSVSRGDWVSAGQQIGTIGNTGRSTGPHLHFSVFRGNQPIDPEAQLGDR